MALPRNILQIVILLYFQTIYAFFSPSYIEISKTKRYFVIIFEPLTIFFQYQKKWLFSQIVRLHFFVSIDRLHRNHRWHLVYRKISHRIS